MPLTRHFYSVDEVHAALLYSTTVNRSSESIFWCNELIISGYASEAVSTLFEAWLWQKGPFSLSWLLHAFSTIAQDELTQDDILLCAHQLAHHSHLYNDNSLWKILSLTAAQHPPQRVAPMKLSSKKPEDYFIRALRQRKAYEAWWMSRHLEPSTVWKLLIQYSDPSLKEVFTILPQYETLLGFRSDEYDTVIRCMAVLCGCLRKEEITQSLRPLPMEFTPLPDTDLGRMSYRRYSIPTMCLYGRTARGRSTWKQSTVSHLTPDHLVGCPFWEEAISEYGTIQENGEIQWNSDESMIAFYDTYFPDDIPDEWTRSEKEKSHGSGCLSPTETITLTKYARIHLSHTSHFAWISIKPFEWPNDQCDPIQIVSLLPAIEPIPPSLLIPIHRRVTVA